MSAYMICDVRLKNMDHLRQYLNLSEHTLAKFGGRFLAQNGEVKVVEGVWNPRTIVVAEFPDTKAAEDWYNSPDYAEALSIKAFAIDRNMIIVSGLDKPK
jgi:uncharacterized protein (DUF1330 family)